MALKIPIIPYLGIRDTFFWPIGLKIFMGTQETIIYRLVTRNHGLNVVVVVVVVKPKVGLAMCRNNIFYTYENPRRALTNMRHYDTLNAYK